MQRPYGIHWFRRDLRIAGNPALRWSWRKHEGRVLGLFIFDGQFLARPDFSHDRFAFFMATMQELRNELRRNGGDLLVLDAAPSDAFRMVLSALRDRQIPPPETISWNRDYEPFARARDSAVETLLSRELGVGVHTERDHLLIEPTELSRPDGGFYQVFTPFSKRWLEIARRDEIRRRTTSSSSGLTYLRPSAEGKPPSEIFRLTWANLFGGTVPFDDRLRTFQDRNAARVSVPIPAAGSRKAFERLRTFAGERVRSYADRRDIPSVDGTSQLSPYFKNGSITGSQVIGELDLLSAHPNRGSEVFLKEIIWREFYYHILYHCPDVERDAFLPQYRGMTWDDRDDYFQAWCDGQTGYPIVDAGMRQLKETGWMHNRVRMIVASFLTKDLLCDWRRGERYFMEKLLDGDLAPNNGGWQWAASTGCDPQPYFRIFNPSLQSKKFDPDGLYIRRWVPELRDVPIRSIHDPEKNPILVRGYPRPIVDHAERRTIALDRYRASAEKYAESSAQFRSAGG